MAASERCGKEYPLVPVGVTGTKGHFANFKEIQKKLQIFNDFLNFLIFGYLNCLTVFTQIFNHHYSHIKVPTYDPVGHLSSNYSISARLTSSFFLT
jgi:hypothetical protein